MTTEKTIDEQPKEHVLRKIVLDLPCILTSTELLAKGEEVAKLEARASELRLKKKEMTGEINGHEGAIRALLGHIRGRSEVRAVRCREIADFEVGVARTIRDDIDVVIAVRPLNPEERQQKLKGIGGGKKPPKKDDIGELDELVDVDK